MGQNHCHQGLGRDLGPDGPLPSEGKGPHRGTPVLSQLPLDHSPGTERHRWTRHHPAQLWDLSRLFFEKRLEGSSLFLRPLWATCRFLNLKNLRIKSMVN